MHQPTGTEGHSVAPRASDAHQPKSEIRVPSDAPCTPQPGTTSESGDRPPFVGERVPSAGGAGGDGGAEVVCGECRATVAEVWGGGGCRCEHGDATRGPRSVEVAGWEYRRDKDGRLKPMPPKVHMPHGGWVYNGPVPGIRASENATLGAIKRKARRHLDQLVDDLNRAAERGLKPRAEGEAAATAAEVKAGLDAMKLLNLIAEPTRAEDNREDAGAPQIPTITVLAGGGAAPAADSAKQKPAVEPPAGSAGV